LNQHRKNAVLIFDMNVPESLLADCGYRTKFTEYEKLFTRLIGPTKSLCVTATLQNNDYAKYDMTIFDETERKQRRAEVFPQDLKKHLKLEKNCNAPPPKKNSLYHHGKAADCNRNEQRYTRFSTPHQAVIGCRFN
jgi:hypothetical protein